MNEFRIFVTERVTPEDVHKSGAWIVYLKNEDAPGTYPDPFAPILPSLVYVINFKNLQGIVRSGEFFPEDLSEEALQDVLMPAFAYIWRG